jgi:hypothetical protein
MVSFRFASRSSSLRRSKKWGAAVSWQAAQLQGNQFLVMQLAKAAVQIVQGADNVHQ